MSKLYPYLYSEDARAQAAFYAEALGGTIESVQTFPSQPGDEASDRVMHLILRAAGHTFFMADASGFQRGTGMDLVLEFSSEAEARQAFERLAEGGKVLMPFERMFWGAMFGRLTDAYGVRWQIATEAEANG